MRYDLIKAQALNSLFVLPDSYDFRVSAFLKTLANGTR